MSETAGHHSRGKPAAPDGAEAAEDGGPWHHDPQEGCDAAWRGFHAGIW